MTAYEISDGPKMLRETLCVAQTRIGNSGLDEGRRDEHIARLGRLIDECDRHRPLGPDGKHGNQHTPTCGCDDIPQASTSPQRIRFVRDVGGDLYIEIPGRPGRFADVYEFGRGTKYPERYNYSMAELEIDGPATIEWDSSAP